MVSEQYYTWPYLATSNPMINNYATEELDMRYSTTLWKPTQHPGSDRTNMHKCLLHPLIGVISTQLRRRLMYMKGSH